MTRVVVVGAGAVGSCVAYQLACAGARVVLVDGADPANSLSAHSFGWANPVDNGVLPYYELTLAGLSAHERLATEITARMPVEPWLFREGNLHWARTSTDHARLRAVADGYLRHGYPVLELSPADVHRDLEPALRLTDPAGPVIFYPSDAHVLGDRLLAAVRRCAHSLGVLVRTGDPVVDLVDGNPVRGVRLASGERIDADTVVCCAGRGTSTLLDRLGAAVPLVGPDDPRPTTRGLLVRTTPVRRPVRRVVHAPGLSIRPDHDGRLMLHCHDVDEALTATTDTDQAVSAVFDRLATVLSGTAEVGVDSAYLGIRPMPRDGMSVLGWLPGAESVYVAVTHSGLTLAAVLGEVVRQEVLSAPHPLAGSFRPDRFTATG